MNYNETSPFRTSLGEPTLQNGSFRGITATTAKSTTLGDQVNETLLFLQNTEKNLIAVETNIFGPMAENPSVPSPPYSSVEGNLYELRSIASRLNNLSATLLNRI